MYVGPVMAGFLGGLAIAFRLPGYEPKRHEGLAVSLGLGLAVICPLAVYKLSPATSVPFWVSLVLFVAAFSSFGTKGASRSKGRAASAQGPGSKKTQPSVRHVEARVHKWAVPMGTARGLMAILVKGIAYNVVSDGNRKRIQPSDEVVLKATQDVEIAAGEAANKEILSKMGAAIGRNTTGGALNLGAEFDSFQDRAFSNAKQAVIDIGKSAKGENWVLFVAQTMDIVDFGLYEVNDVLWDAVKNLNRVPLDEQAWKAAREAVESGIVVAIVAARKCAMNAGIVTGWGKDAKA